MDQAPESQIPAAVFADRRARALASLGSGVMVLPAAPIQHASRDTERPYVPDRELYYLTGFVEPGAVAVLVGRGDPGLTLFVSERSPDTELWAGPRMGPDEASEALEIDGCHPLSEMAERLPDLLAASDRIHYRPGRGDDVERLVFAALSRARGRGQRAGDGPRGLIDPGEILDELRLRKDEHEMRLVRRACEITIEGHRAAAVAIEVGAGEWAVEAALESAFRRAGATGVGFGTIVGGGANACVLHYVENRATIPDGGLVLVDAGAEQGLYHGDVTRTWPASGTFTSAQRDVYEIVDAARAAGIEATAPGRTIAAVHDAAVRVLVRGLLDLGVLEGDLDGLIEQGAHRAYYPHQTSHWLGLDVHDPGDYARDGASRTLESGMVFTVEPGLYFAPGGAEGAVDRFTGIGIRIEDDVLVTEEGREVLTADLPTSADEIEALVREHA